MRLLNRPRVGDSGRSFAQLYQYLASSTLAAEKNTESLFCCNRVSTASLGVIRAWWSSETKAARTSLAKRAPPAATPPLEPPAGVVVGTATSQAPDSMPALSSVASSASGSILFPNSSSAGSCGLEPAWATMKRRTLFAVSPQPRDEQARPAT